jgi:uroporphyrinogen decarboxylase
VQQEPTSTFLRACRGLPVDSHPVWYMRQAGRSLPEYRKLREGIPMLESCFRPDLVAEITLQPVRRHGVDAAVVFSDIVVPLKAAGVGVTIEPGVGPVVASPIRDAAAVEAFPVLEPGQVEAVAEAIRLLVGELGAGTPVIGFCGGPFTLASYLIEGGPSKDHVRTKALMHGQPAVWDAFAAKLADIAITFVSEQVRAGAGAVQVFDSWAGALSERDYRRFVLPHSTRIFDAVRALGVPTIHFGVGTGELLGAMTDAGPDVVGVDWRVPLDAAAVRTGGGHPLQGNLDPALLFAPWDVLTTAAGEVLQAGTSAPGHVFNLGHGVLPSTDPEVLTRLTAWVHEQPVPAP